MISRMDIVELQGEWDLLASLLPSGWQEAAREQGALRRARNIKSPEVLLRLILLHAGAGLSLRQASARARTTGLAAISDVALFKRLRKAEPWLRWMTTQMLRESRYGSKLVLWETGERLRVVDATTVQEPGATGTSWKVHYSLTLPTLLCDFFEVTDARGGETYERLPIERGDIVLGDRGYCHREGVAFVKERGGDVVVRLNSTSFPLMDLDDQPLELLPTLRTLEGHQSKEWSVRFEASSGRYGARLCAIRKSSVAAQRAKERIIREAKKRQKRPTPQTLEAAEYIFVLTTIAKARLTTAMVLELYRARWQVELAFKRLKSLMQAGHVPKYDQASAQAWIQAKLLSVLMIERLQEKARFFSPWGFQIP